MGEGFVRRHIGINEVLANESLALGNFLASVHIRDDLHLGSILEATIERERLTHA